MKRLGVLDRKLVRDLWGIRGQALAIAAVVAAGVAIWVLMLTTFQSLGTTQRLYYQRYRFGDVFAGLKRAPDWVAGDIAAIPGVARVETRVVTEVTLDMPDLVAPASARLVSIPAPHRPVLNDVFLRRGRFPEAGADADEVLLSEGFADAHGLGPGDSLTAVINGRRRRLAVVGVALSPEFVYVIRPGELLPDDRRFAVIWMPRRALAAATDMDGAFNDVSLLLDPGEAAAAVIPRLDRVLAPWGGRGAVPRALQPSNFYLSSELEGLRAFGSVLPVVFLAVAAFLLNVVLARTVALQRGQIAAIKALGYGNRAVGLHYVKWALVVAGLGAALGTGLGAWLGRGMTEMYTNFFDFPILHYRLAGGVVAEAVVISLAAAVVGALAAVRRAVSLPPAEAMRPDPPASFSPSLPERLGLHLSQPIRIVLRTMERHPGRTLLSVAGIAFGGSLVVAGVFSLDSVDLLLFRQFGLAQRYDAMVTFTEPTSAAALEDLARYPGVRAVEPMRSVPVRLRCGHRSRATAITSLVTGSQLSRVIDRDGRVVEPPEDGLLLSATLARVLGAKPGDELTVEVLEGRRPVRRVPVVRLVHEYMGTNAYMSLPALHRLLEEGPSVSGAYLAVDSAERDALYRELKRAPRVAGVMLRRAALDSFNQTMGEMVGAVRAVSMLFAAIIAAGVVYNGARISLSERRRELATLRVVGFTRAEIATILLGEIACVTVVALPLSLLIGYGLAALVVKMYDTEVWRMPLAVSPATYALAAITVIAATLASAWVVRRKLDRLDLIAVLKTRE